MFQTILTKTELDDPEHRWLTDLGLSKRETDDDSYEDLVSFLLGSLHISLQDRIVRDGKRLVGNEPQLAKLKFPDKEEREILSLQGKPLGDIKNIFFWDPNQRALIRSLKERKSTLILGDYGVGKTIILTAAGRELMTEDYEVHFISALGI